MNYPTYNTSNGKLYKMLEKFIETFNDIEYPLSKEISSPIFLAGGLSKCESSNPKYNGYYKINISVDMFTDVHIDNDRKYL